MRRTLLIMALISSFGCRTVTPERKPDAFAKSLSFKEMVSLLRSSGASTVEEGLAAIAKDHPDYLRVRTAMYDSLSLQEATFQEPRVIVFGPRADFVFTFNGSAKQRGGYAFETMEYDYAANSFLFREIVFKKEVPKNETERPTANDIEFEDARIQVSKANLERCTQCHGLSPSPIWETYFMWPGAYGSNDDILTTIQYRHEVATNGNYAAYNLRNKFRISQGRMVEVAPGHQDREFDGYVKWIAGIKHHPRYRHLPDRATDEAFVKLNAGITAEQIDISPQIQSEAKRIQNGDYYYGRPNKNLLLSLYKLTGKRIVAQLFSTPRGQRVARQLFWTEYCGRGSMMHLVGAVDLNSPSPVEFAREILTDEEVRRIEVNVGSWRKFYQDYLTRELEMESEKLSRHEFNLGKGSIRKVNVSGPGLGLRGSEDFYSTFLKKLPNGSQYVLEEEADWPYGEAARAYLAKGLGFDLKAYALNMRRLESFRESGFKDVFIELGLIKLFNYTEEMYSCDKLKTELLAR